MTREEKQYCQRAVVRYLNGDMKEYHRLVSMVMQINKQCVCSSCGSMTVPAKIKLGKRKYKRIELCTRCGLQMEKKHVS